MPVKPGVNDPGRTGIDANTVCKTPEHTADTVGKHTVTAGKHTQSSNAYQQKGRCRLAVTKPQKNCAGQKCTKDTGDRLQAGSKRKYTPGNPKILRDRQKKQGGKVVVRNGEVLAKLPLPVAGLMSDKDINYVTEQSEA